MPSSHECMQAASLLEFHGSSGITTPSGVAATERPLQDCSEAKLRQWVPNRRSKGEKR